MSDYVKSTNFYIKDTLLSGNPDKIVKGSEIDTEFNNIATAVASKANYASPALTGIPTAPTASTGNSTSQIATTAFVAAEIIANEGNIAVTGGTMDNVDITHGTVKTLDEPIAVNSGGTGKATLSLNNVLLGNGTAAVQEVAPGTVGNALVSDGTTWKSQAISAGVGEGQTWQSVTRSAGTTYTNSTGRAIMVAISIYMPDNSSYVFSVSGVTVLSGSFTSGYNSEATISIIVPSSATYLLTLSASSVANWAELR